MSAAGDKILRSIRSLQAALEAGEPLTVHVPDHVEIRALRKRLGMSQARFAAAFGFDVRTLQNWEQGHRHPEGPTRAYLKVIDHDPDAVRRALAA
jgi:putative transcriptional regulator